MLQMFPWLLVLLMAKVCQAVEPHEQVNKTKRCAEATKRPTTASAITCSPYGKDKGICRFVLKNKLVVGTKHRRRLQEAAVQQFEDAKQLLRRFDLHISKICNETIFELYCHHYFPVCDYTTAVVLKQPVCKESCFLLFENCKKELKFLKGDISSTFDVMNCTKLPNKNAGDSPACYHHPSLNSRLDKRQSTSCYHGNGMGYIGTINVTRSGKKCQSWSSQCPHRHIHKPENYIELMNASSWCRNPGGEGPDGPWCYTTESSTRWEYCNITKCSEPVPTRAPMLTKAVALNGTAIFLAWKPVATESDVNIQGYLITLYRHTNNTKNNAVRTVEILLDRDQIVNTTLAGLQPGTNYSANMSAFTEYGKGPSSNTLIVLTPSRGPNNTESSEPKVQDGNLAVVAGITVLVAIIITTAIIVLIAKRYCTRPQEEIVPYATVSINNWLQDHLEEARNIHVHNKRKLSLENKHVLNVSPEERKTSQLYKNLDIDGEPLAGKLAGAFEMKHSYINVGQRYQNTDIHGLPVCGELLLVGSPYDYIADTGYSKLVKKGDANRQYFEGRPNGGCEGEKQSDFIVRRSSSFHDFGRLSRKNKTCFSRSSRRKSLK